jgi:hypothetical protein
MMWNYLRTRRRRLIKNVVMCDLDSTICNTYHRSHLAPKDKINGDWLEFSMACQGDGPIEGVIKTVKLLYPTNRIAICSGRDISALDKTITWLAESEVPYDEIYLCDYSVDKTITNWQYKVQQIADMRSRGYNPVLFIEDFPFTAQEIEKVGVPVLCVNPRYEGSDNIHSTWF